MKNGFLIPEIINPDDFICVTFEIPNDPMYRQAVRGHIWELARWFNWEQTVSGDTRASEVATLFRTTLLDTLEITENCGGSSMGQQEIDDICEGVLCALVKAGAMLNLASIPDNIEDDIIIGKSEDESGFKTTIKNTSESAPTPDIDAPLEEILFGQAMAVGEGFRNIVGEIILRRTTQARTAQNVADILRRTYFLAPVVDAVDALADAFGTPYTNATDTVTPAVIPESIARIVYCNGANRQSLNQYAQDLADANGTDAQHISDWYFLLIENITDEQIEAWYEAGVNTPRNGYNSTQCYRLPSFTAAYSTHVSASNHQAIVPEAQELFGLARRFRVAVTGLLTDATGAKYDGYTYYPVGASPVAKKLAVVTADASNSSPLQNFRDVDSLTQSGANSYVAYYTMNAVNRKIYYMTFDDSISLVEPIMGELTVNVQDLGAI